MRLADKIATMARRGENPLVQWTDGKAILYGGGLGNDPLWSASDFIQCPAGHSLEITTGYVTISASSVRIYSYTSSKSAIVSPRPTVSTSGVTWLVMPSNGVYLRSSCPTANKLTFSIYDNTDGRYIVKDGVLLVSTEGGGY